jgi:hypothetical protein
VADLLVHAAAVEHMFVAHADSASSMKKSMRGSRPLSSLRDSAIGLPVSAVMRGGQACRSRHQRGAKALHHRHLVGHGHRGPGRLRRACGGGLGGHRGGVVGGTVGDQGAGGGVVDGQRGHGSAFRARRAAGGQEVVEHRRVVDGAGVGRVVEFGVPLHAGHVGRPGVVRRKASTMPSSGQRASTTKPGARSFTPWWWMLLATVRGAAGVQLGQPRAGHEFHRVEVAS